MTPTVWSVGGDSVTVPAPSETALYLDQVIAAYQAAYGNNLHVTTLSGTFTNPTIPGPTTGGYNVLVVPTADNGMISVGGGYQDVECASAADASPSR